MPIMYSVHQETQTPTQKKKRDIENEQITVRSLLQRLEDATPTKRATV